MKIYVVTRGCYSDYRIIAVFESKEKAEHYAKYHSDYDSCIVEVYDTEDTQYQISAGYIKVTMNFASLGPGTEYRMVSEQITYVTTDEDIRPRTLFYKEVCYIKKFIYTPVSYRVIRYYPEEQYTEEFCASKTLKIGYDIGAEIRALEAEGYSDTQIKTMMEEKYER